MGDECMPKIKFQLNAENIESWPIKIFHTHYRIVNGGIVKKTSKSH